MQQTISQAAQLYGKARSTIHRAIASGRLSCSFRGDGVRVIDLAELIRLWGEPIQSPDETQQNATQPDDDAQQGLVAELRALREEVKRLREEVRELRTLPAPGQLAAHPDDAKPPAPEPSSPVTTDIPPRNFGDVLARFEARNKPD